MKVLSIIGLAFLFIGGVRGMGLLYADTFTFTFDEYGVATYAGANGTLINGYTLTADKATLTAAPIGSPFTDGITGVPLSYNLPEQVAAGVVGVFDSNSSTLSDLLVFTNAAGNFTDPATEMIFYSLADGTALADTGIPTTWANKGFGDFTNTAIESADSSESFTYRDAAGNTYNGVSGTPEPASLSLFLLGVGSISLGAWRRNGRSCSR